jgi:acyl-coenzyme A synthetase/AMP-(fatty) acid ligase
VTLEYLQFHAVERPEVLAFADGTREVGFAAMLKDFAKVAAAVRMLGLVPGQSVAVGCDDFYTHWLLLLAFEHLGIATASFQRNEGAGCRTLLGAVDLVLAEPDYPRGGWRSFMIGPDWLATIQAWPERDPPPGAARRPEQVHRIVRTSGTTGTQKRLNLTYSVWAARLTQVLWLYRDLPAGAGLLVPLPISLGLMQRYATLTLASGLTLVAAARPGIAAIPELIRRYRVASMLLLPIQLKQLLDHLPPGWTKPEGLELATAGAPLPPALRAAALENFAWRVGNLYGSNETGIISIGRSAQPEEEAGVLAPGAEIRILDEQGREVPDGTPGQICVRGASVFHGYADDPSLTRRVLRDGWFTSGDFGIRNGLRLQLVGRSDDQANLGGVKHALTKLEALIQQSAGAGLRDVGVAAIANAAGLDEIHAALVTDGQDDRAVLDRVAPALRALVPGDINFIRLEAIPRNEMGKIDRARLKQAILDIQAERRGA